MNLSNLEGNEPVTTSQGDLYVRYFSPGDSTDINDQLEQTLNQSPADLKALGEVVLKRLTSRNPAKDTHLSDADYLQLIETDIAALVAAISQKSELDIPTDASPIEGLGSVIFNILDEQRKIEAKHRSKIDRQFSTLNLDIRTTLNREFSSIFRLQNELSKSPIFKLQDELSRSPFLKPMGNMKHPIATNEPPAIGGRLFSTLEELDKNREQRELLVNSVTSNPAIIEMQSFYIPPFEKTAAGRTVKATEATAEHVEYMVGLMKEQVGQVTALQTTFMMDVLPTWKTELESSAASSLTTFRQGATALKLTALGVFLAFVLTGFQMLQSHFYQEANDKQQDEAIQKMQQQLDATRELNRQLLYEAQRLNHPIIQQPQPPTPKQVKEISSQAPTVTKKSK